MLPTVYLETTIPSYLAAWPSRDVVRAAHQQLTRQWWQGRRNAFEVFISQFVLDEASAGDAAAAEDRLREIRDLPQLEITVEVVPLARSILATSGLPVKAATDAAHIAVAAVHGMDFLLTWNCAHINNAQFLPLIEAACRANGYSCPVICTPEELMGL